MHLLELQCRDSLDFKYNVNIEENPLNLNIDDYLDLAIRNNKKRRFLFVSKTLGKHLPCKAEDMNTLGKNIVKAYEKKQDYLKSGVVISFAETGTALGHSVFNYIKGDYEFIHTTREIVENKKSLDFLEEHSHATNHNLYYEDLQNFEFGEEIILVDDEITTGNTCINLIEKINSLYPKKRYTICSILNWMDKKAFDRFENIQEKLNTEINFVYLFSGDFTFECDEEKVEKLILNDEKKYNNLYKKDSKEKYKTLDQNKSKDLNVSYIYLDIQKYSKNPKYIKYTGRFGINKIDQENLLKEVKRESEKLNIGKEKTLFLGSEEFMYIPMLFAKQFEGKDISYHSTTRSPIIDLDIQNYPIKSKFPHHSLYNEGVVNYVYNLDKYNYEKCFFFCELNKEKEAFDEIINIISNTNIKELNIVMCK